MATVSAMITITDVSDLNGRNLVLNSHEEHSRTVSSSGANGVVPYYSYSDFASEFTHRQGQILTVSFDYETSGNTLSTGLIYVQHNESQIAVTTGGCLVYILDNPSGHYSKTFRVTATQSASAKNTIRVCYKTCSPGTVIKIKNIKVETGDKETPWTPAPEDVNAALDDAKEAQTTANNAQAAANNAQATADEALDEATTKNSVYYQTTAPTGAHKVGDTWFDTGNDYKISRWNGSAWVAAELGDQAIGNLNASHINAGTLTAVDIEAGKSRDIAGTIKVYDEDDAVKVSLDKDGLVATKGKIGNWDISSYSIEYQEDVPSGEDVVIGGDGSEELIGTGTPTYAGGETLILKICTYDPDNPSLGPHIISSVVENGNPLNDNGKTMRISNGGLACYYNRNTGTTGGFVNINPKLISVGSGEYDEDQVLWRDSANLNPGSLIIACFKTESGEEQQLLGRSYLTYRDLSFIGDANNPQLASGIAHWSVLSPERALKDTLKVTVYHCGNLFWARFSGKIPAGLSGSQNAYLPIVDNDDSDRTQSIKCAPPAAMNTYLQPQYPSTARPLVSVTTDGRIVLGYILKSSDGTSYTTVTDNIESCGIFWAHIG